MRWFLGILIVVGLALYLAFSGRVEETPERPPDPAPAAALDQPEPVLLEILPSGGGPCVIEGTVLREDVPIAATVTVREHRDGFGRDLPAAENHQCWLEEPAGSGRLLSRVKTGEDGRFRIPGLRPGRVLCVATAEDGARGHRAANVVEGTTKTLVLPITGGAERIEGTVRWSDGRLFAGVVWAVPKVKKYTNTRAGRVHAVPVGTDGAFVVGGLPKGIAFLSFLAPGEIEMTAHEVPIPSFGLSITIDGGFVDFRGRVLEAGSDAPIEGARVVLGTSKGTAASVMARTDAEGRFLIRAPGARGGISVTADGFASWLDVWPKVGEEIEVRLLRPGRVRGRVVSAADGSPVGGVAVRIERAEATTLTWWTATETAGSDGRFACEGVAPGTMRVFVLDRGWASAGISGMTRYGIDPLRVEVGAGKDVEVELPVLPAGRAIVRLVDAAGTPLAGKSVRARLPGDWRGFRHETGGRTGEDGTVVIQNLVPGFPYTFEAKPREELPVESGPHRARSGAEIEVTLKTAPCRWLPVRVTWEEDGSPVAGATAYCARKAEPYRTVGWGRTDRAGATRVGPLPREALIVRVSVKGAQVRDGLAVPGSEGPGELAPMELTVARGHEISGRLTWDDGSPRSYEQVVCESDVLKIPWWQSVELDGAFRFQGLPPGSVRLSVQGKAEVAPITVEAGATDIVYRTGEKPGTSKYQSLGLRVVGPDGKPVRSGKVWLHPPTGQSWPILGGRCATSYLDPDDKAITFEVVEVVGAAGERLGSVLAGPFDPADGEATVRLGAGRSIEGVVLSPDGAPARGVVVRANPAKGKRRYRAHSKTYSGADGTFVLAGLGEKEYELELTVPDECTPAPKERVAAGRRDVLIRLRAGKDVTLTILDATGRPMLGVVVYARKGELTWRDNTDERGVARLLGVPAGERLLLEVAPPRGRTDVVSTRRKEWWPADETIRLGRAWSVSGVVVDAAGAPVRHARVYYATEVGRLGGRVAIADSEGKFRVGRLRGTDVWLLAVPRGAPWPANGRDRAVPVRADAVGIELVVKDR